MVNILHLYMYTKFECTLYLYFLLIRFNVSILYGSVWIKDNIKFHKILFIGDVWLGFN